MNEPASTDRAGVVVRDGVAFLAVPAPGDLTPERCASLVEALAREDADAAVRSIVIDAAAAGLSSTDDTTGVGALLDAIARASKRVYLAIGGPARGAGFEVALLCDGVYASPQATFAFAASSPDARALERLSGYALPEIVASLVRGDELDALQIYSANLIDGILVNDLATEIAIFAGREAALPRGRYDG